MAFVEAEQRSPLHVDPPKIDLLQELIATWKYNIFSRNPINYDLVGSPLVFAVESNVWNYGNNAHQRTQLYTCIFSPVPTALAARRNNLYTQADYVKIQNRMANHGVKTQLDSPKAKTLRGNKAYLWQDSGNYRIIAMFDEYGNIGISLLDRRHPTGSEDYEYDAPEKNALVQEDSQQLAAAMNTHAAMCEALLIAIHEVKQLPIPEVYITMGSSITRTSEGVHVVRNLDSLIHDYLVQRRCLDISTEKGHEVFKECRSIAIRTMEQQGIPRVRRMDPAQEANPAATIIPQAFYHEFIDDPPDHLDPYPNG